MKLSKRLKKLGIVISSAILFNLSSLTVSADANTLNIQVHMAQNQFTVYGLPGSFDRLTNTTAKVRQFYLSTTGIKLNFDFYTNNNYIHETLLETCSGRSILDMLDMFLGCRHWENTECTNGTISMPSIIHHTNAQNVMNQLPNATTNYAVMLLSPNSYCMNFDTRHSKIYGKTWPSLKELTVSDLDYVYDEEYSSKTKLGSYDFAACVMAHEIGHLYGITDHYYDENVNCIWGKNREEENIYTKMVVCSNCLKTLRENVGKYNHTPLN